MNIPEVPTPPTRDDLQAALRTLCRDHLYLLGAPGPGTDRPRGPAEVDPADVEDLAAEHLLGVQRWTLTEAGREALAAAPVTEDPT